MQMTEEDGRIVFTSHLKAGENVRFLSGPFADMVGALERLDANGRVLVLLDILGRVTQVKAKAADLEEVLRNLYRKEVPEITAEVLRSVFLRLHSRLSE